MKKLFHKRLFTAAVRGRLVLALMGDGRNFVEARELASSLDDEMILGLAEEAKMPVGKLGDGKLMEWILAHQEEIAAFIAMIMKLFAGFSAPAPAAPTPVTT